MKEAVFTIAAVERDTGLAKDTLRVWERRYGFPAPARDANGERVYPLAQVERLRLIKRLMDQGFRPGKLVTADADALAALSAQADPAPLATGNGVAPAADAALLGIIEQVRMHDAAALRGALNQTLHRQGLQHFVLESVPRLNAAVGEAWMRGEFEVFEEHLYTEQMQSLLRQSINALPAGRGEPRVVITTVPDEQHVLGLLMIEALLTLEGAACISLGTQTPVADIAAAARAHRAQIVALTFSSAFPARQIAPLLAQLRVLLPPGCEIWVGGAGCARLAPDEGVTVIAALAGILQSLAGWRVSHGA